MRASIREAIQQIVTYEVTNALIAHRQQNSEIHIDIWKRLNKLEKIVQAGKYKIVTEEKLVKMEDKK